MTIKKKQKKEDRKGVVYEIPCHKCEKSYIGETGRTLSKRIKEHKYAVCSMNMNITIARHSWSTGNRANWERSTVIGLEEHPVKRKILLEGVKIQNKTNNMNLDEGMSIHSIWKQFY